MVDRVCPVSSFHACVTIVTEYGMLWGCPNITILSLGSPKVLDPTPSPLEGGLLVDSVLGIWAALRKSFLQEQKGSGNDCGYQKRT